MSTLDLNEAREWIEDIFAKSDAQPMPDGALPGRPVIPLIKALLDAYSRGYLVGKSESGTPDQHGKLQYAEGRCAAQADIIKMLLDRLDRKG